MKFQTEIVVVGMKASKGTLDNGQVYDSTKAYALTDMDTRKGNAIGQASSEFNIGDASEYDKYKHLQFPLRCVAEMELVTTGSTQRTVITGLRPVEAAARPAKG